MAAVQGGGSDCEEEQAAEAVALQVAAAPAQQELEKKKMPKAKGKHHRKHLQVSGGQDSGGRKAVRNKVVKGSSKFVGTKKRPRQ